MESNENKRASMEGRRRARAVEWALGRAGNGTEQIAILFRVCEPGPHEGRVVTWRGYFTEQALETTVRALRALGWEGDDLSELGDLAAREAELVIEQELDQDGVMRDRVRWVNGAVTLNVKERLGQAEARSLADRMAARIAALGVGRRGSSSSSDAAAPAGSDDAIPF